MVFGQEKLIPEEWEDYFRENFEYYWNKGLSAKEIAEELQFNDPENAPWRLKVEHVYYFAEKYGLPKRKKMKKKVPKGMVQWKPEMPPDVVEFLRTRGVLWDDPEKPTTQK